MEKIKNYIRENILTKLDDCEKERIKQYEIYLDPSSLYYNSIIRSFLYTNNMTPDETLIYICNIINLNIDQLSIYDIEKLTDFIGDLKNSI